MTNAEIQKIMKFGGLIPNTKIPGFYVWDKTEGIYANNQPDYLLSSWDFIVELENKMIKEAGINDISIIITDKIYIHYGKGKADKYGNIDNGTDELENEIESIHITYGESKHPNIHEAKKEAILNAILLYLKNKE